MDLTCASIPVTCGAAILVDRSSRPHRVVADGNRVGLKGRAALAAIFQIGCDGGNILVRHPRRGVSNSLRHWPGGQRPVVGTGLEVLEEVVLRPATDTLVGIGRNVWRKPTLQGRARECLVI